MREERNRENKDFVMFFRPFMDELTKMAGDNYTAYKLFQFFCKNMDGTNALIVSTTALSEIMNVSTKTIQRAVKYLKENGWVCVMKSGTSNVYIVNPDVAWTAYADQKATCSFKADVILSGTENAEYLKNPKATSHYKRINEEFMQAVRVNRENFERKTTQEVANSVQIDGQMEIKDTDCHIA